jgi:hypothetical protein
MEFVESTMSGHIIHIGYAKIGTNFLRQWFRSHPQLGFADGEIAGFNDACSIVRAGACTKARHFIT